MDLKFILGVGAAAAGIIGATAAAASKHIKAKKEISDTSETTTPSLDGSSEPSQIEDEMNAAWEEHDLNAAEEEYFREQRISDETQQAWIEKEMLDDGYTEEEVRNAMSQDLANTAAFAWDEDDEIDDIFSDDDDDNDEDYDEDDGDGEPEIDNTDLSYEQKFVFIRLNTNENERRNRLKHSLEKLRRKYPEIQNLQTENVFQTILDNEFREGFSKNIFIRNLSFQKGEKDILILALRPEIVAGDYLLEILPKGVTLMFRGHVSGREFVIDDIYDTADTEQLDYEVFASVIPRKNPTDVKYNFFYDVLKEANSLTEYTGERLKAWREYLTWHKQICIRQIYGFKYYRFQYDAIKKQVIFFLVSKDEASFKKQERFLKRDIQVFNNGYSENPWVFEFVQNDYRKQRSRSIELGRCRSISKGYYLKETVESALNAEVQYDIQEDEQSENEELLSNRNLSEQDVLRAFQSPYIVKVAYDLPRDLKEKIQDSDFLSEEDERTFIEDNYLSDINPNGFLALSAVGDLTLIWRLESAIKSLERDECFSPNLAAWLFNIDYARLPDEDQQPEIKQWLNPNIAENENQRIAVQKMIAAPDICLIQGPPGTGKTTVIAEAIYQLVIRGNRVLIASQSNDAVDNALERLADRPEIRAVRVGQKSKKKKNIDLSKRKYSEDEALKYYYQALSGSLHEKWLSPWEQLEKQRIECRKDKVDLQNYQQDVADYQTLAYQISNEMQELQHRNVSLRTQIQEINQQNALVLDAQRKARSFEDLVRGLSDSQLFLTEQQLRLAEPILNPMITSAQSSGVLLTLKSLSFSEQGVDNESELIRLIVDRIPVLKGISNKISEAAQQTVHNSSSIDILINQRNELRSRMSDAAEMDNMEEVRVLRAQLNAVKEKIEAASGNGFVLSLSSTEKYILSEVLSASIISGKLDGIHDMLETIIQQAERALQQASKKILEQAASMQIADVSELNTEVDMVNSRLLAKQKESTETNATLDQKRILLQTLSQKYHSEPDMDHIRQAIDDTTAHIESNLSESEPIRRQWEDVMRQFDHRLNDEHAFASDQLYYQSVYVKSCNVVGISCTDDMRNLTDKGYDDFDVVIIDEVSKATPPELLIPLMKARKAILVGDHRQLPPMFKEHERSYKDLISDQESIPEELRSLMTVENFRYFRDMVTSSLFKEYFERADESIRHPLLVQYRMHSDIMRVINRFYENRLINGLTPEQELVKKAHGLTVKGVDDSEFIVPAKHAYWIDSSMLPSGKQLYDSKSNPATKNEGITSVYNTLEQYLIIELLKRLADSWRDQYERDHKPKQVGVISFYQAQVNRLREMYRSEKKKGFDFSPLAIDINTVDRFQGKEKQIIITSLVTNTPKGHASKHVITFERINVAFSRAQELLIVVGAKHTYEKQVIELPNMDHAGTSTVAVYQNIMEEMHRNGCFKGSEKLITSEMEAKILKEYQGGDDE